MDKAIRILIVEDSEIHYQLAKMEITRSLPSSEFTREETEAGFLQALNLFQPDLIISDYSFPSFDGLSVIKLALEYSPDIPIIMFTGSNSEDVAVNCIKAGASNYILKDSPKRLIPAVINALAEKKANAEKQKILEELKYFQLFSQSTIDALSANICVLDESGKIVFVNKAWRDFADLNSSNHKNYFLGDNYILICQNAIGIDQELAHEFAKGIMEVSNGQKNIFSLEYPCHSPTEKRWFIGKVTRVLINGMLRLVISHENITDRKLQELAFIESENRLQVALAASNMGVWELDIKTNLVYRSEKSLEITGLKKANESLESFRKLLHADDAERVMKTLQNSIPAKKTFSEEFRINHPDGKIHWILNFGKPVYDENGHPLKLIGTILDITARKQIEENLRQSEERFSKVFRYSPAAKSITRLSDRIILDVNESYERIMGYSKTELIGHASTEFNIVPDQEQREALVQLLKKQGYIRNQEMLILTKLGERRNVLFSSELIEISNEKVILTILFDITDLKKMEADLQEKETKIRSMDQFLANIVQGMTEACFALDSEWNFVFVNDRCETLFSFRREEMLGNSIWKVFSKLVGTPMEQNYRRAMQDRIPISFEAFSPISNRWLDIHLFPSGNGLAAFLLDIQDRKKAEEQLHESEERFSKAFTASPAALAITRASDGLYLEVNDSMLQMFGYKREEMIGHTSKELGVFVDQSREEFIQILEKQGGVRSAEMRFRTKSGEIRWMLFSLEFIIVKEVKCALSILYNITERKLAQQAVLASEARMNGIINSAMDAIITIDENQKVIIFNHTAEKMFGYKSTDVIGKQIDLLIPERFHSAHKQHIKNFSKTGVTNRAMGGGIISGKRASGEEFPIEASISQINMEGSKLFTVILRDITDRVQNEALLTRRVEERTSDLSRANFQLAQAARTKDEFLANMSHELRTPLNGILALSEALLEQTRGSLNEKQIKSVTGIESSGRHLLALINDILDLSKVEAGKLELQPELLSVEEICQSSLLFVKELAQQKNINLKFSINSFDVKTVADPRRIKQILVNLLSNAVKFTSNGGQVHLDVNAEKEDQVISFSIIDTGIGISSEGMSRLFQPFSQLDSSLTKQHEGTGLGLALVSRLTEMHGGGVKVESTVGQGSKFTATIPWKIGTKSEKSLPKSPVEKIDISDILIIEDSKVAAEQLSRYIAEKGINVNIIENGDFIIERVIEDKINVIFLDILLQGISGWDILAKLKSDPRTKDIPVIIVSVIDDTTKALEAGAAEHFVKPISRQQIHAVLEKLGTQNKLLHSAILVTPELETPARKSPLILLAEDNEMNIQAIGDYLQDLGYYLAVARNGGEALDRAREMKPDIILMDIQMPVLDGLKAIKRLRTLPDFTKTPIIALTALAMSGDRERCLEAGANEYMSKPISVKALRALIEKFLEERKTL